MTDNGETFRGAKGIKEVHILVLAPNFIHIINIRISVGKRGRLGIVLVVVRGHFHVTYVALHERVKVVFRDDSFRKKTDGDIRQAEGV